jgi:hemerythrin-like domain-containing protein
MKPIDALMGEHQLIGRMVQLLREELRKIGKKKKVAPGFIEVAVDFFRIYTDRTHQGKEEDILFRALAAKPLFPGHKHIMDELRKEHIWTRKTISSLVSAKDSYEQGNPDSLKEIIAYLEELLEFYLAHIDKEDNHFFYPAMEYFSRKEQDNMLEQFYEFDKKVIHEKYQGVVETFEKGG